MIANVLLLAALMLPARSSAWTVNTWPPTGSGPYDAPVPQAVGAPASRAQVNEAPASAEKPKDAVLDELDAGGVLVNVGAAGGAVSMVTERDRLERVSGDPGELSPAVMTWTPSPSGAVGVSE